MHKERYGTERSQKKLRQMLNGYGGAWSVYVKDLKSGAVINLNDQEMYPASTIKAFVMASTFDQIQKGKLKYNATVKSLLTDMITVSDNEACNQLIRYNSSSRSFLDGAKTINRYLSANKYTETGCHHSLHPAASSYAGDGRSNVSSAKDCRSSFGTYLQWYLCITEILQSNVESSYETDQEMENTVRSSVWCQSGK